MARLDMLIRGGSVVDGSGSPARRADVGILDRKITAIGEVDDPADTVIDADGKTVAPGFIDVHTHYDAQAFWDPSLSPSCFHGVTTVLGGNCGFSIAPLSGSPADSDYLMRMLSRVEGIPLASLKAGVPWDWRTFGEFLERLDGRLALNAGFLVGHSALRRAVMGSRAVGESATPADYAAMQALLRRSIEEGGLGLSSSFSSTHNDGEGRPVPSRSATVDEVLGLAEITGEFEGTYLECAPEQVRGFSEATRDRMTQMSRNARRPINWNFLLPNSTLPQVSADQLAASDYAAARGGKIIALAPAKPPSFVLSLAIGMLFDAFPGWAEVMALPIAQRMARLSDPVVRRTLNDGLQAPDAGGFGPMADWSKWTVIECFTDTNKPLEGLTIGAIASRLNKPPLDTLLDISVSEDLQTLLSPPLLADDGASWRKRAEAWNDERVILGGSDAGAHLDMIDTFALSSQFLGECVRDRRLISLEAAVHRLTDRPARAFGLRQRGLLKEGYWADIVVFDRDLIGCGPVHSRRDLPGGEPRLYVDAIGVSHVMVNGTLIVANNRFLDVCPGTVLRAGRDTYTASMA